MLQLTTLVYGDEVVAAPKAIKSSTTKKEVEMAEALVEQLASAFRPKTFKNEHSEWVLKLIAQKSKGQEIVATEEPKHETMSSLAEALERRLSAHRAHKPARAARRAPPKRRAAARGS